MRTAIYPADKALFLERYHLYLRHNTRVTERLLAATAFQYEPLYFGASEVRLIHYWLSLGMPTKEIAEKMKLTTDQIRRLMTSIIYKLGSPIHAIYWRPSVLNMYERKLNESVLSLPLNGQALKALVAANINSIEQLLNMSDNEIQDIKGIGDKAFTAIKKELAKRRKGLGA